MGCNHHGNRQGVGFPVTRKCRLGAIACWATASATPLLPLVLAGAFHSQVYERDTKQHTEHSLCVAAVSLIECDFDVFVSSRRGGSLWLLWHSS